MFFCFGFILPTAVAATPEPSTLFATNINQLYALHQNAQRTRESFHLEAVVCAVGQKPGQFVLSDASAAIDVVMDLKGQDLHPGQEIVLDGVGIMNGSQLNLIDPELINNDGTHSMISITSAVSLKAGMSPIRVEWFNEGGNFGLNVFYEGPDIPYQKIPGASLFRPQADASLGVGKNIPGLDYRYYENPNYSWSRLPDFKSLTPVKTGTVTNFDLGMLLRTNEVAVEFEGVLEVPQDGIYRLTTESDDGSKLYIGELSPATLKVVGLAPVPVPRPIVIGQGIARREHQWSEVEGTVTFISQEATGWELELSSASGRMRLKFDGPVGNPPLFLLNNQVRVRGISHGAYNVVAQKVAGTMLMVDWGQIELRQISDDYWTLSPLVSISNILSLNAAQTNQAVVRIKGTLRLAPPGAHTFILEDETGRIPLAGTQPPMSAVDSEIEVLGIPQWEGVNLALQNGFYRVTSATSNNAPESLPVLTSAKQVQFLSRAEAMRKYPVKIRGVVTSTLSWFESFILQDATRGIFVHGNPQPGVNPPHLGDFYEVEGVTDPSDFAPIVVSEHVKFIGPGRMPEPLHPTRDQLVNGSLDAQYVEIQGVVTAVESRGLTLLTLAGKYKVNLYDMSIDNFKPYENALVRIKGCFYTVWDQQTRQIKIGQIRISDASINIDSPAPNDVFSAPAKSPAELLSFDAEASALKRIKVSGQIIHERAGQYYLQNGTNGLRFFPESPLNLQIGETVDVVGFPELGGASPILREAIVRKTGKQALPEGQMLLPDAILSADYDAARVRIISQLVGFRTNRVEQVLELQTGPRTFLARLNTNNGSLRQISLGSRLDLTGVYSSQGGDRTSGRDIDSFELLLNSPSDVSILSQPAWWTTRRILAAVCILVVGLLLALTWITGLRRRVHQQTRLLRVEIEEHKRIEVELAGQIEERKRMELEVERIHSQLLTTSRQAGMAEVATNVLHNVGNVLNSVNVSCSMISDKMRASRLPNLAKAAALLQEQSNDLPAFFTSDPRARQLTPYLAGLSTHLAQEQKEILEELSSLGSNIEHIKAIVSMQQNYSKTSSLKETLSAVDLVEDALRMNIGSMEKHKVEVVRHYDDVPPLVVDKHKALQILVNLISNAKQACAQGGRADKKVTLRVGPGTGQTVRISVIDNGIGISQENLTRIFGHGFTTRKDGHGYGLHSGSLGAKELGGSLTVESKGQQEGAVFTLELPFSTVIPSQNNSVAVHA